MPDRVAARAGSIVGVHSGACNLFLENTHVIRCGLKETSRELGEFEVRWVDRVVAAEVSETRSAVYVRLGEEVREHWFGYQDDFSK